MTEDFTTLPCSLSHQNAIYLDSDFTVLPASPRDDAFEAENFIMHSLSHQNAIYLDSDLTVLPTSPQDDASGTENFITLSNTKHGLSHQNAIYLDSESDLTVLPASPQDDASGTESFITLSNTKHGLSHQNAIFDSDSTFLPAPPLAQIDDFGIEDFNDMPLSLDNTKPSNRVLSRQNAIYMDSIFKFHDVEDKFNINTILVKLDAKYPHLDFLQYEEALQKLGLYYLETANMLEPHFYQSRSIRMSNEAAELFRHSVSNEYMKALLEHERGKMRRILGRNSKGEHISTVPTFFST